MKSYLTVLFGLFLSVPMLHAQSVQKVQVFEYKGAEPKVPLEGVTVAVLNAPQMQSDPRGEMQLQFRTLKKGEKVQVRRVEKVGYELFNNDALQQWNISEERPFRIVMCRTERLKSMREQYLQMAHKSYQEQYQKEMEAIEAEFRAKKSSKEQYEQKLMQLQQFYGQQTARLENYVNHFTRIDLSELSAEQAALVRLVSEGRFKEAIEAYEKADYVGQFARQNEDIHKIQEAQKQLAQELTKEEEERMKVLRAIDRQVTTYQMAGGMENYRKAAMLLRAVAEADTLSFDGNWLFTRYLYMQGIPSLIEKYGLRCAELSKGHVLRQIASYTSIHSVMDMVGQTEKSDFYLDKAIEVTELHLQSNEPSKAVLAEYANLLSHKGEALCDQNEPQQALALFVKAEPTIVEAYQEYPSNKNRYNLASLVMFKIRCMKALGHDNKELVTLSDSLMALTYPTRYTDDMLRELYSDALNARLETLDKGSKEAMDCAKENYDFQKEIVEKNPSGMGDINLLVARLNLADAYLLAGQNELAAPLLNGMAEALMQMEEKYQAEFHDIRSQNIYLQMRYAKAIGKTVSPDMAKQGLKEFYQMQPERQASHQEMKHFFEAK